MTCTACVKQTFENQTELSRGARCMRNIDQSNINMAIWHEFLTMNWVLPLTDESFANKLTDWLWSNGLCPGIWTWCSRVRFPPPRTTYSLGGFLLVPVPFLKVMYAIISLVKRAKDKLFKDDAKVLPNCVYALFGLSKHQLSSIQTWVLFRLPDIHSKIACACVSVCIRLRCATKK